MRAYDVNNAPLELLWFKGSVVSINYKRIEKT